MTESNQETGVQKPKNSKALLWAGCAIAAIYIGGVTYIRSQCTLGPDLLPLPENWWGSCAPYNEFGDFLAGFFAPLAFLAVALAVLLQSRELAAQRIELELTRQEMAATREVLKAQAEESRRTALFMQTQTEIQKSQQKYEAERLAGERFDNMKRSLVLGFNHNIIMTGMIPKQQNNKLENFIVRVQEDWDFATILRNAANLMEEGAKKFEIQPNYGWKGNIEFLSRLLEAFHALESLRLEMPIFRRLEISEAPLHRLITSTQKIIDYTPMQSS